MDEKYLNIVSFNVPYPPNYGGAIDVFYKLKSLAENNVKIILHTFDYGRGYASELEKYCTEVHYYKRKTGIFSQLSALPYIVISRKNKDLLINLQKNNYPILFEGLHTCYYLAHPSLKNRLKMVRIHNIEHYYYKGLSENARSPFLRTYFSIEASKLKKYEKQLRHADYLLVLSSTEQVYFEENYGKQKTIYVPLFFQDEKIDSKSSNIQPYVLFHGDLSTPENINAASFLIQSVVSKDATISWIFAGLNPSKSLLRLAEKYHNVTIKGNLSKEDLSQLLSNACVNILYTNQVSGVKLKLLNALFNGQYCLANQEMVNGSGLEDLCTIISDNPDEILAAIKKCFQEKLQDGELIKRMNTFNELYNNQKNALIIRNLL